MDPCFDGTLTSADRLYLDRLWQALGVDPKAEAVHVIEARLILAALREQVFMIQRRQQEAGL
jgi:hypothetical protein